MFPPEMKTAMDRYVARRYISTATTLEELSKIAFICKETLNGASTATERADSSIIVFEPCPRQLADKPIMPKVYIKSGNYGWCLDNKRSFLDSIQ